MVTVSGKITQNMTTLITCFLEFNTHITALLVYYGDNYKKFGPLYNSICNVKDLITTYSTYLTNCHAHKLNLELILDIIFQNSRSLEMIIILKSSSTNPIDFANLATQIMLGI